MKIEVPTDTRTESGDTAANIQRRRVERQPTEREDTGKQQKEEREEAKRTETPQSTGEAVAERKS